MLIYSLFTCYYPNECQASTEKWPTRNFVCVLFVFYCAPVLHRKFELSPMSLNDDLSQRKFVWTPCIYRKPFVILSNSRHAFEIFLRFFYSAFRRTYSTYFTRILKLFYDWWQWICICEEWTRSQTNKHTHTRRTVTTKFEEKWNSILHIRTKHFILPHNLQYIILGR